MGGDVGFLHQMHQNDLVFSTASFSPLPHGILLMPTLCCMQPCPRTAHCFTPNLHSSCFQGPLQTHESASLKSNAITHDISVDLQLTAMIERVLCILIQRRLKRACFYRVIKYIVSPSLPLVLLGTGLGPDRCALL